MKPSTLFLTKALRLVMLFDGADFDTYNVFYVNHKRVQVNGKDYAAVSAKAGYVPKLTAILENVNNHDIVYVIAVPLIDDYTKARILKQQAGSAFRLMMRL